MSCEKEARTQRKEEREDLEDIARSENEGFGIISGGYGRKKDKKMNGSGLASKK